MSQGNFKNQDFITKQFRNIVDSGVYQAYYDDNNNPRQISFSGYNNAISGTLLDNNVTGNNFDVDTVGAQLSVVSTSIEDAVTGTGIGMLLINGLDTSWDEISENLILTGTTSAVTTKTFLRVNSVFVLASGSTTSAVGTITATGDGFTWFKYLVGESAVELGRYSVPRNHTYIVTTLAWTAGKDGDFNIHARFRQQGALPLQDVAIFPVHNNSQFFNGLSFKFNEKSDVIVRSEKQSGAGQGSEMTTTVVGWLFNNLLNN